MSAAMATSTMALEIGAPRTQKIVEKIGPKKQRARSKAITRLARPKASPSFRRASGISQF